MGIQAWFIILGVGAMTLIVWDGKRRKKKQRASNLSERLPQTPVVSASSLPNKPHEHEEPTATNLDTPSGHATNHLLEGSRIGAATHILGNIIADEPVLIKGRVEGAVIAPNHPVSVTATGHIASYLEGSCVDVDGYLVGTLKANTKATLLSRAHLEGVVEAPSLECMAGAWLKVNVAGKTNRPKVAMIS